MGTAQNTPIHTSGREEMKAQIKKTAKIIFVQNLFHKEVAHVTLCHILSSCFLYLAPTGARSAKVIQAQKKEEEDERIKWKILIALFT